MYLNTHSSFSFKYGTLSPEALCQIALKTQPHRITLTDINTMAAHAEFAKTCEQFGIRYNLGVEFHWKGEFSFIAIARDPIGYTWINTWLSQWIELQSQPGSTEPEIEFLESVWFLYPPITYPKICPENVLVGVRPKDLQKRFAWRSSIQENKLIACPTLTFETPKLYGFHKVLRAIGENELIERLNQNQTGSPLDFFRTPKEIEVLYSQIPGLSQRASFLSEECDFNLDFSEQRTLTNFHSSEAEDRIVLRTLTEKGKIIRYGDYPSLEVQNRIEKELEVIGKLKFQGYYLITNDIIRYASSKNYRHVGRGSGANSIVAYCLGITDVDPIALDLYFERFLNASRNSPPDFDIDFSWKERDEIIRYILKKYNSKKFRASQLAATVRYKSRSVVRELGKVFGLPRREIEKLTGHLPQQYFSTLEPLIQDPKIHNLNNPVYKKIIRISEMLHKMPSHLSIHAGGILIAERNLYETTATFIPPKGFPVAQIDMFAAEDLNLHKLDILSQRGLGHIRDCIQLIASTQGLEESEKADKTIQNTAQIVYNPESRKLLKTGETIGCFYIESPAMRSLIQKLGCDNFEALTAASSVIRPGVGHSGMMRAFIARFRKEEPVDYLHPILEKLLKETLGVMIYQEDVLKVAHYFGGLSLEQADVLRRGMSGKLRSLEVIRTLKEAFFESCLQRNINLPIIQEVWRQMESFSGYTFPKAHSASFAVESFQDLYLKQNYPLEFITAVINNFGGFYNTWFYLEEAKRLGASIALPCVNQSNILSHLEGKTIRLGFIHISGIEQDVVKFLLENRSLYGNFTGIQDFIERIPCGPEQIRLLIRLGCFDFTKKKRPEMLWEARLIRNALAGVGNSFFPAPEPDTLQFGIREWSPLEMLTIEIEYLGFPVSRSFFDFLEILPPDRVSSSDWRKYIGKEIEMAGYICARKPIKTKTGKLMQFITFRDPEGVWDGVLYPKVNESIEIQRLGPWLVRGKVQEDFGVPVMEIWGMRN